MKDSGYIDFYVISYNIIYNTDVRNRPPQRMGRIAVAQGFRPRVDVGNGVQHNLGKSSTTSSEK